MTRTVGVLTGTRAEFGILLPVLRALDPSSELRLRLFVTGMHLAEEFGRTLDFIPREGFEPVVIDTAGYHASPEDMARGIGGIVQGLVDPLRAEGIDLLLLLGDRGEMLAGAVAATYLRIPIAHIHGGERSGHVDEAVRHAISRLAHLHLTATVRSAELLRRAGEEPWRISVVGAPRLDTILQAPRRPREEVLADFDLDPGKPVLLLVQHPTAKDRERSGELLRITLDAALTFDGKVVAIYPNGDPGSLEMIEVLREYADREGFPLFKSLPEGDYLDLLAASSVLIGNSSSGIIEAPSLGVPVVNIGDRQDERERASNVIDVPHDRDKIEQAVRRALHDRAFKEEVGKRRSPYGDGHASERIVRILATVTIDDRLLEKRLTL